MTYQKKDVHLSHKGIVLAGGRGSRLFPLTNVLSKQLLPIYDKPMIYYPLSVLLEAGIQDVLLISTAVDILRFQELLHDGSQFGMSIQYAVQDEPRGIADAFLVGETFIGTDPITLILGDNIFHGPNMDKTFTPLAKDAVGGKVYGYEVHDPERYGVLELNDEGKAIRVIEKPEKAPSPYAVTGLYSYDNRVVDIAKDLQPSKRGELEITDVNSVYLEEGTLDVTLLQRGFAWLDTGTHEALQHASQYVQAVQMRQGIQVACLEEIAYRKGFITEGMLEKAYIQYKSSTYGDYLERVLTRGRNRTTIALGC